LGHIVRLPEETPAHTVSQHVINVTKVEKKVTLQQAGSVRHEEHG